MIFKIHINVQKVISGKNLYLNYKYHKQFLFIRILNSLIAADCAHFFIFLQKYQT